MGRMSAARRLPHRRRRRWRSRRRGRTTVSSRAEPRAQQAIAVARDIVPGGVVDVRRDRDNGKWEVTIRQGEREYEVELAPGDLALLRVDYDWGVGRRR